MESPDVAHTVVTHSCPTPLFFNLITQSTHNGKMGLCCCFRRTRRLTNDYVQTHFVASWHDPPDVTWHLAGTVQIVSAVSRELLN
jgi:hypothetical protein